MYRLGGCVVFSTSCGNFTVDLYEGAGPELVKAFLNACSAGWYLNGLCTNVVPQNLVEFSTVIAATGQREPDDVQSSSGLQALKHAPSLIGSQRFTGNAGVVYLREGDRQKLFIALSSRPFTAAGGLRVLGEVSEGLATVTNRVASRALRSNTDARTFGGAPVRLIRVKGTLVVSPRVLELAAVADVRAALHPLCSGPQPPLLLESSQLKMNADFVPPGFITSDDDTQSLSNADSTLARHVANDETRSQTLRLLDSGLLTMNSVTAPDEKVLFVCKLNPVTTSDGLATCFSRFGRILSCQIIRDRKSGSSLQYGFVEFGTVDACNRAFSKMDNVLVDDSRIHVNFCQSINTRMWPR